MSHVSRFLYRRQYILAPTEIDCPFLNKSLKISHNAILYTHLDLICTEVSNESRKLILLGDLFDYEHVKYHNIDILRELVTYSFARLPLQLEKYSGRYVLIICEDDKIHIMHDAAASRKIYYYQSDQGYYCASQPHLLSRILQLPITENIEKLDFYKGNQALFELLHNSNIGNTTCYDDVFQVMANHYMDFYTGKVVRYWPNKERQELPVEEVVERLSLIIRGIMESICYRYPVMLPVTAGKDSRVLLAASRKVSDSIFCYVNQDADMPDNSLDLVIPNKLLAKLNLKFNILNPCNDVDPEFERAYFENDPFASKPFLPIIYEYYKNFENRVNLPGSFSETGLTGYQPMYKTLNENKLASYVKVDYQYARDYYRKWLNDCQDVCNIFKYDPLMLFYWEERIGNWGTQIQLFKDIAQEEFMPYDSHLITETMLKSPLKYRDNPDYLLMIMLAKKLWPETMQEPVNPTTKMRLLAFSRTFGGDQLIKYLYYLIVFPFMRLFKNF